MMKRVLIISVDRELPVSDMMTFPDTWEEFEKSYGFTDNEEVYTNGARLIPSFRVKQWLEHLPSAQPDVPDINVGELISRQEAIDAFWKLEAELRPSAIDAVLDMLKNLPSVQPRKGKWIYGEHDVAMCDGYRCNKCGFFVPWDYQHKFIDFIKDYNYCPSCGANMRGDSDEVN